MTDVTGYKPNKTLIPAILEACEQDGMGWYGKWRVSRALRRLTDSDLAKLEQKCTALATESGLPMGTDEIVAGCYTGAWGDGAFFQMLIDNLPKILEFIKALLPLFMMFATILLAFLLCGVVDAQCPGGQCQRPVMPVRTATKATVQVAKEVKLTPCQQQSRVRVLPRLLRRWR